MVAVSMDDARLELDVIEKELERCVKTAWSEFRTVQGSTHPGMRVRARRTLLQDLVVKEIEAAFGGIPGFRVVEGKGGRVLLVVADKLVLQFRHVNREFRTANYPTPTAKAFDAQRHIEGLPPLPRLTIGYRLDKLETEVVGVFVIFAVENEVIWQYKLNDREGGFGTETLELFPRGVAPSTGVQPKRRVGPKRTDSDEAKVIPIHSDN